jgi:threonine dehydrogenase-like Zn-dependent dehydrogenase
VGICGTDFHAFAGEQNFFSYPRVLGHELAVEVLALGPTHADPRISVGDRCAVMPYLTCGRCRPCRAGRSNCCERVDVLGVTVDGGLHERMLVPMSALYPRADLTLDQLALVETLGIGMHAVERGRPEASDSVLVIGVGPIGLAIAQCLAGRVDSILVADISELRLGFAERTAKVETLLAGPNLLSQVIERSGADLPSLVFDATGSRGSMEQAVAMTGAGGRLVLVGHTMGVLSLDNPTFHRRELDLHASRNAVAEDWAAVVELVANDSLDPLPWVTHRSTLETVCTDLPGFADDDHLVKAVVHVGPEES